MGGFRLPRWVLAVLNLSRGLNPHWKNRPIFGRGLSALVMSTEAKFTMLLDGILPAQRAGKLFGSYYVPFTMNTAVSIVIYTQISEVL